MPFEYTFPTPALAPFDQEHLKPDCNWHPGAEGRPRNFYALAEGEHEIVVSVVTPAYNSGAVLDETAEAVFGQSLQAWEWIIVDDGSTDPDCLARLERLRARDPRVCVLHLEQNRGLPGARNAGLQRAQGEYIFLIDDDDLIEPTTLEKLVWFLKAYPHLHMTKGSTAHFGAVHYHDGTSFQAGNMLLHRNHITPRALVRREALLAVGGFDETLVHGMEDWDLWLKLADHGYWGHGIPEFLDWYRRRQDHSDRWSALTDKGVEKMRSTLRQRYPRLYREGISVLSLPVRKPYAPIPTELPLANRLEKTRPRVLLLIPWMALGGADRFNLNFLQDWVKRGYEVTVVATLDCNYVWYREYARLTPDIFILPYFLPPDQHPRFLDYLISSRRYDAVLVTNSEWGYQLLPYLRSRHPEVPFVDCNHIEEEYYHHGGYPRLGVGYQEALDLNLVTSQHLKAWMVARGADGEQVDVVYTNVDTERFSATPGLRERMRAQLHLDGQTPVLIYAGRICAQKQPAVFAEVMRELVRTKQRFVCLVVGEGEDLPWLKRYISRNHLQAQVRVLGAVPNDVMRDMLAAGDIFFLPSLMEGISLAIYEAMAMGLAIVGADVGGQKELVTPDTGILVQRAESAAVEAQRYIEVLQELLGDPERIRGMGQNARARVVEHFPLSRMGEEMVSALLDRAPALHAARPKPVTGTKLALEHVQLTLETHRLAGTLQPLLKYGVFERSWGRFAPMIRHLTPLRRVKDAIWIVGHRVKVRLGMAKD